MKEQIPDDVASERLDKLQELLEKQRMNFARSLKDQVVYVLFDNIHMQNELQVCGRDEFMHLVIYNCKAIEAKQSFLGKLMKVKITEIGANALICELC